MKKNWNIAKNKDINFAETLQLRSSFLSTGVKEIDEILGGGYRRGSFNICAGSINMGKFNFCRSVGASVIRQTNSYGMNYNNKVLHIQLERDNASQKYASILSKIPYKDLANNNLSQEQKQSLDNIKNQFTSQLKVINITSFDYNLENLNKNLEEVYQNFKFDLVIIDSPQLFDLAKTFPNESYKVQLQLLSRHLVDLAFKYDTAILSPYAFTPDSREEFNKNLSTHIIDRSGSLEIMRLCHSLVHVNPNKDTYYNKKIFELRIEKGANKIIKKFKSEKPKFSTVGIKVSSVSTSEDYNNQMVQITPNWDTFDFSNI